jgi:hypothetical protein
MRWEYRRYQRRGLGREHRIGAGRLGSLSSRSDGGTRCNLCSWISIQGNDLEVKAYGVLFVCRRL